MAARALMEKENLLKVSLVKDLLNPVLTLRRVDPDVVPTPVMMQEAAVSSQMPLEHATVHSRIIPPMRACGAASRAMHAAHGAHLVP